MGWLLCTFRLLHWPALRPLPLALNVLPCGALSALRNTVSWRCLQAAPAPDLGCLAFALAPLAAEGQRQPALPGAGGGGGACLSVNLHVVGMAAWFSWSRHCEPQPHQGMLPSSSSAPQACCMQGWSPERSMKLGGAMLEAVLAVTPQLR